MKPSQLLKRGARDVALAPLGPYLGTLGLRASRVDRCLITMPFKEDLIGSRSLRALHGGTLLALLQTTAALTLATEQDLDSLPRVLSCTTDYLRSGKARDIQASAEIVKSGSRFATLIARAWQDDESRPVVIGTVRCATPLPD